MTAATAAAQQPPTRERQERQVVVPSGPNEPVPEVRVAARVTTWLRFNALIDKASLEVEGRATRFKLVDPGEYTLALEIAVEPEPGERLILRVRYKEAGTPAYATLALVTHPTLVDKEVEVVRRLRTPEVLEAALAQCEAGSPSNLVLSGRLDLAGVRARRVKTNEGIQAGMRLTEGIGYRATTWAVVAVGVHNLPGQQPWTAGEVRLTRADGTLVKVRSVRMDRPRLAPGETGLVVAELEAPSWKAGEVFRVEVREKGGGRHLVIGTAEL
ncbi:DUF2381 family protein [Archangium sp.]|uniref:DUF2381 family protein n=1 Tax=Archangium sp. TaxID=1872627 RepID=UPI00286AA304|nr:DUF2381 family protein [Archangium sp.]